MKNIITILTLSLLIISCGSKEGKSLEAVLASKDLKVIRAKKTTLNEEKQLLLSKIKQLDDKIAELDTNKRIPLVTAFKVKEANFNHYLELQGNVQTKQNVLIYPEMAGQLQRIFVKEGQRVSKGQILAKIDDGGMVNQLVQLQAAEALAKTTFERQERLWKQKIGSEIQYLQAETNYKSQQNAVKSLQRTLGKYNIRAPFSGVIDNVIKDQGTVIAPGPGSEVFRIVNLSKMYIETDVPESYINTIKAGKEVTVDFPVLGKTVTSKVRQAGNFINPTNRTFKIEIPVNNRDKTVKPNLTAKLKINDYTNAKAILIPQSIISENSKGEQYVYVISNLEEDKGTAKQTIVTTGKTQGDKIEILEGISAGDQLIEAGARSVKDGQQVKISQ